VDLRHDFARLCSELSLMIRASEQEPPRCVDGVSKRLSAIAKQLNLPVPFEITRPPGMVKNVIPTRISWRSADGDLQTFCFGPLAFPHLGKFTTWTEAKVDILDVLAYWQLRVREEAERMKSSKLGFDDAADEQLSTDVLADFAVGTADRSIKVSANKPKYIFATNHSKSDYRDLAVKINQAVMNNKDNRSENQIAKDFFKRRDPKEATNALAAIRQYERRYKGQMGERDDVSANTEPE
jgi:hypothetical protein